MVRKHNHEGIIQNISHFEEQFRIGYKMINGSSKNATRAYKRVLESGPKRARKANRQHDFKVLTEYTLEINEQLICEQLFIEDFIEEEK